MLTQAQKNYLAKQTKERANQKVFIRPYEPVLFEIAKKTISKIIKAIPKADVRYMGASALQISGQNDVDIYVMYDSLEQKKGYSTKLSKMFSNEVDSKWHWYDNDIEITLYLADTADSKLKENLSIFYLLKDDPVLLKEYEKLKESMNGRSYVEYQTAKYEFFNRVLGITE